MLIFHLRTPSCLLLMWITELYHEKVSFLMCLYRKKLVIFIPLFDSLDVSYILWAKWGIFS